MSNASNMAGIAFNLGGLGMVHSMAHQLGGMYHVPHGLACALALPAGIAYNSRDEKTAAQYADLTYKLGLAPRSLPVPQAVCLLQGVLKALMSDMGMPQRIGELPKGPDRSTYEQAIPMMLPTPWKTAVCRAIRVLSMKGPLKNSLHHFISSQRLAVSRWF